MFKKIKNWLFKAEKEEKEKKLLKQFSDDISFLEKKCISLEIRLDALEIKVRKKFYTPSSPENSNNFDEASNLSEGNERKLLDPFDNIRKIKKNINTDKLGI